MTQILMILFKKNSCYFIQFIVQFLEFRRLRITFFHFTQKKSQLGSESVAGFETWASNKLRSYANYG